jgi:hypothetical protein
MDSFEDGEDIGSSSNKRNYPGITDICTFDQTDPFQFLEMKTQFQATEVGNPYAGG